MKKKVVASFITLVVISIASFNLLTTVSSHQTDVILAQIEALANSEEGDESGCPSGGPGSFECSHSWTINYYDENGNVIKTERDQCIISCGEGFYACCRRGGCFCVNNNAEMP